MDKSWFDKGFNGDGVEVKDDCFDDVIEYLDLPFEDGADCDEEWDCNLENLEPPPTNVLAGLSTGFYGDFFSDSLEKSLTISCDESSQLNPLSSTTSITLQSESTDVKGSNWFQTSSPVSELESSSSWSGTNSTYVDPKLSFPVKRGRSKRRRASTFNLRFILASISSTPSASRRSNYPVGFESESESHLSAKKRQKKKRNLTFLSGCSIEIKKSPSQHPIVVTRCTHCRISETPQWREGPMGPKTLCNACGVRYRSGRLFPEYRPAASPTFVPSLHSNSHKKVIEMRKKAKLPLSILTKMSLR